MKILDQFGKPFPDPPNPYDAYDAVMSDLMGEPLREMLARRSVLDAFAGSRLVDAHGHPLPSQKQYTFSGRSVRVPFTVVP